MQVTSITRTLVIALAIAVSFFTTAVTYADVGQPVAVRRSDGCFVIESMWNLSVQIVTADQFRSTPTEGVDLMRTPARMSSLEFRSRQDALPGTAIDFTLDRAPNENSVTWAATADVNKPTSNAIRVRATGPVIVIDVDGVRIVYVDHDTTQLNEDATALTDKTDVLIVGPPPQIAEKEDPKAAAGQLIESRILVLGSVDRSSGNTVAVCAGKSDQPTSRRIVFLGQQPLTLPAELEQLMADKEAACTASQKVFAELSVPQMNFRPGNGTHTPRWNAEHMMGRELLFFSQIFHARDSAIPVMDLNPKQMPPDYVFRHPDWTGREEARQMQRVASFTSRFAHLLKDLPLDEKAPGSNWTLRGLLRQMERHYSEHTTNVKKKFELQDWPRQ